MFDSFIRQMCAKSELQNYFWSGLFCPDTLTWVMKVKWLYYECLSSNNCLQCEVLWFPECGAGSWDSNTRTQSQNWSEILGGRWIPCRHLLSPPRVPPQVICHSKNLHPHTIGPQCTPSVSLQPSCHIEHDTLITVQLSDCKQWRKQLVLWKREASSVLSPLTLAIRYSFLFII